MGTLGQIWIKLGLKADEFKKGLKESEASAGGFGSKLKAFGIGWVAIFTAVGTAVAKFAKDAINLTQKWGDTWQRDMAGIKASYDAFIGGLATGEGWESLKNHIGEARRLAREAADEIDALFEMRNSANIESATLRNDIAKAQLIYSDSSKSDAERLTAADEAIAKTKKLGEIEKVIRTQEYDAYKKNFQAQSGMNDSEIEFLVYQYNANLGIIDQAREYEKQRSKLLSNKNKALITVGINETGTAKSQGWQDANQALLDLEKNTPDAVKKVGEMTLKYDSANDKLIKGMVDSKVALISLEGETDRATRRANSSRGAIVASMDTTNAAASKATTDERTRDAGLISSKQDIIKELENKRDLATDPSTIMEINSEIEKLNTELTILQNLSAEVENIRRQYKENPLEKPKPRSSTQSPYTNNLDGGMLNLVLPDSSAYDSQNVLIGKAYAKQKSIMKQNLDEETEMQKKIMDEQTANRKASLEEQIAYYKNFSAKTKDIMLKLDNALNSGVINSLTALGEAIGSSDQDYSRVLSNLIDPLADAAIQAGVLILSTGGALETLKTAFINLFGGGPAAAVIAGAALVALGVAAKAGAAAIANSGSSSSSTAGYTAYSGGYGVATKSSVKEAQTIQLTGEFKVKGQDLQLALDSYNSNRKR